MNRIWYPVVLGILIIGGVSAQASENATESDLLNISAEYLDSGEYWGAIKYADMALALNRSDWVAWTLEMLAYNSLGKPSETKVCAQKLIELAPNDSLQRTGYYYLGLAEEALGNKEVAKVYYLSNVMRKDANPHMAFLSLIRLGWMHQVDENYSGALKYANEALGLAKLHNFNPINAYDLKIAALNGMKQWDSAIGASEEALRLETDPKTRAWILMRKASAYAGKNQIDMAEMCLIKAIELDGEEPKFWMMLSRCYILEGDLGSALAAVNRAIELDQWDGDAWKLKGDILSAMGYDWKAMECYENAGKYGWKPV